MTKASEIAETVSTSKLCSNHIGLTIPASFIVGLGAKPAYTTATGYLWSVNDVPHILMLISKYFINKAVEVKNDNSSSKSE